MADDAADRKKLFQGAGLVAFGIGFELLFSFFAKVGVAKYLGTTDFGLFSVGFALVSVSTIVALVGLPDGIARTIPRADSKQEEIETILTGLLTSLGASLLIVAAVFLVAGPVVSLTSHGQTLVSVLQISSLGIPLLVVARLAVGVGRGYEKARVKVVIQNLLRPGAFFLATATVVALGIESVTATYIIPGSYLPGAAVGLYYLSTHLDSLSEVRSLPLRYDLLVFSAPLMISGFMRQIMNYLDTFIVAAFQPAAQVGIYNAVYPLSRLSSVFLAAFGFIVMPVFSSIDSASENQRFASIYAFTTKWITVGAVPVVLVFSLLPTELIITIFGEQYSPGHTALLILTLGFFANTILGPNANALIALGKSRSILRFTVFSAVLNIGLNLVLIPRFGIEGAAIATALSYTVLTLLYSAELYRLEGIVPINWDVVSLVFASAVVGVAVSTAVAWAGLPPVWMLVAFGLVFGPVYLGLVFATGTLSRGDISELVSLITRQS